MDKKPKLCKFCIPEKFAYKAILFKILGLLVFFCSPINLFSQLDSGDYRLNTGDVISISVLSLPKYNTKISIGIYGKFIFPLIGEVKANFLSIQELKEEMEERLNEFILNPNITITLEEINSKSIAVIGDVFKPGTFNLYEPVHIMTAIGMASGSKTSSIKQVFIVREGGHMLEMDVDDILAEKTQAQSQKKQYYLYPGDILIVFCSFGVPWTKINTVLGTLSLSLSMLVLFGALSGFPLR